MKTIYKNLLILSIVSLSVLFAAKSQASVVATMQVTWDYTLNVTTASTSRAATEFDIRLTAGDLDLINFDTYGYCVELTQSISKSTYTYNLEYLNVLNNTNYFKAAWLMDQFAPGEGVGMTSDEKNRATALQGLIWELAQGIGVVTNTGAIGTYYATYKNALNNLSLTTTLRNYLNDNFMIAQNSTKQDLIVEVPNGEPVPEPATMLLLGTGLIGLAGFRQKKKRSSAMNH